MGRTRAEETGEGRVAVSAVARATLDFDGEERTSSVLCGNARAHDDMHVEDYCGNGRLRETIQIEVEEKRQAEACHEDAESLRSASRTKSSNARAR